MNFFPLEKIADAVLYEGYILYPYRPSSLKNRQRWNFGTLYPRTFAERPLPTESCSFHAEVLIAGTAESRLVTRVRFLQLIPSTANNNVPAGPGNQDWSEGLVRSATVELPRLGETVSTHVHDLDFPPSPKTPQAAAPVTLAAQLTLSVQPLRESLWRLTAIVSNETPVLDANRASRNHMQPCAFISAHLLLGIDNAQFVSLLDPDPEFKAEAAACVNQGVFPVLAGDAGHRSRMLCSPIILYDYPQIAPESAGDFFDGTEMDEMLALRVLTLTDEEKSEMRRADPHTAAILARTETLPGEHLLKLHGAVRGMRPVPAKQNDPAHIKEETDGRIETWNPFDERPPLHSVRVFGVEVHTGDRVRLWPGKRADILDAAMTGKLAIVEAIEQDLEGNLQFAVVLEDDPGKDLGLLRQAGHRFFFTPDEIEPLGLEVP